MAENFRIESDEIGSNSIQEEIERRVEIKREAGIYSKEIEALLAERLPEEEQNFGALRPIAELDYAATRALESWDVTCAYPVSTEKRLLKPFVIFFKRLARFWARIAVGPIQREQSSFNRHAARALESLKNIEIEKRQQALAAEKDLAALSEALVDIHETSSFAEIITHKLQGKKNVVLAGPAPETLGKALEEKGFEVLRISSQTTDGSLSIETRRPVSFISELSEGTTDAILFCELSFWLEPEKTVSLARKAYLALRNDGLLALLVHGFAKAGPAPAWCSPVVLERALEIAGFREPTSENVDGGAFLVCARK
ncbi:MAG: hypothetical protein PHP64_04105 [Actinomycetota bacterium]|nr:hypothetical protein [Actinomycetota bacterium]